MEPKPQSDPFPQERPGATVLFVDVQGFTALVEQLDSEAVSDLTNDIASRLAAIVEDGRGYMDKHMGDGVLALLGAPSAGECDAQNALEAESIGRGAQGTFEKIRQAGQ
jgi:adenylate cyclase